MAYTPTRVTHNGAPGDLERVTEVDAERYWYLFAISGLVSAVVGVLVIAYPGPSVKLLGVFLGIELVIGGALMVVRAFGDSGPLGGPAGLLLGVLGLIAGVLVIRNPGESLALVALAFAIYLVVAGAVALGRGIVTRERRGALLARGALLLAAGTVIVAWPGITVKTLALLAGISLLVQGGLEIAEAFALRSIGRRSPAVG